MPRASNPITVTLGDLHARVAERVKSGAYGSASEVVRAGLRALDREEAAIDAWLRTQVEQAFADPRPSIPAEQVFDELWQHHAARVKAEQDGKA